MRASIFPTGLMVSLGKEDKSKKELECIINGFENIKVFLNVVGTVKYQGSREEPGFHMQCYPKDVELRKSKEVHLYLSKERWNDLTTKFDPETYGGYFGSRCKYDRCEFSYWDEELIPKIR
jgi:hypothetical protein